MIKAKWLRDNALSLAMFGCFLVFLIGLSVTGAMHENEQLQEHGQPTVTYLEYLMSGEFAEAVFENWESEFLQMWALVMLTIVLRQKGSADSKKLIGKEEMDTRSRYSIIQARGLRKKGRALGHALFSHSLGLALLSLFLVSFLLHMFGGVSAYNQEAEQHGTELLSVWQYVASSQFWFESFQNWQSEFLAVGTLLVLSIFLRERGSPESKPIGESNAKTGS